MSQKGLHVPRAAQGGPTHTLKGSAMSLQNVSFDSGSSAMKAYAGPDRMVEFPAIVRELDANDLDGKEIEVSSKYYLVGHTAATSLNRAIRTPHIEEGFHGSTTQYVQMCYAMEELKINGKMGKLIVSLPYTDSRKKDIRKRMKERKRFVWSVTDADDNTQERCVEFQEVHIVAQGVGAMQLHSSEDGSQQSKNAIMCIDVGSCTTDLVSIRVNEETGLPNFCRDACTTIENVNVNWFKDQWAQNLHFVTRNMSGTKTYDYFGLMQHAIKNDFMMQYGDRRIDIKPAFDETKEEFTKFVKQRLIKVAGELWDDANIIIFTGGGTYLINFEMFGDSRITRMDQWANARGQFEMFQAAPEPEPPKAEAVVEAPARQNPIQVTTPALASA